MVQQPTSRGVPWLKQAAKKEALLTARAVGASWELLIADSLMGVDAQRLGLATHVMQKNLVEILDHWRSPHPPAMQ